MTDTTLETPAQQRLPRPRNRAAGAVLIAGSGVYFTGEFITAAAWTDPPYSYTYHFISNLGVRGPVTAVGQFMYSPLASVMNTGFILFGLITMVGVILLRGLPAGRRVPAIVLGVLLGAGGIMLGLYPGSAENAANGAPDFHALGAAMAFISGNVLAILIGRSHHLLGFSRGLGKALVLSGLLGFVSLIGYGTILANGTSPVVGLVERGIVDPFLIGLMVVGAALLRQRQAPAGAGALEEIGVA
ncbi:DUF998 domain-containing protein [Umezawaea endophytica]|uniref:DUF998 domain-containing protein n=1 Tax=Umezawaea endophytica TaxID=1654476 RepID=A0A9X2VUY3_9PSEU|nr:DUF998 domain-containing protein [Umezawaea endophytica]MCS7482529.1 DUF998 domain-containing protein [Umezawaea endophytica]